MSRRGAPAARCTRRLSPASCIDIPARGARRRVGLGRHEQDVGLHRDTAGPMGGRERARLRNPRRLSGHRWPHARHHATRRRDMVRRHSRRAAVRDGPRRLGESGPRPDPRPRRLQCGLQRRRGRRTDRPPPPRARHPPLPRRHGRSARRCAPCPPRARQLQTGVVRLDAPARSGATLDPHRPAHQR